MKSAAAAISVAVALLAAGGAGAGTLSLSPSPKNFGNVLVGNTSNSTVTLLNTGSATTVNSVTVTGANPSQFSAASGCGTLPVVLEAGQTCTLNVSFQPAFRGVVTATLAVASSGNAPSVTLQGTGVAPELSLLGAPVTLVFASRPAGTVSAAQTFTVSNTGDAALDLVEFFIASNDDDEDWVIQPCGVGVALAPGASCQAYVQFAPVSAGDQSATLRIVSNDPVDPDETVTLIGTGSPGKAARDFDGDGRSDILWRNSATGENYLYPMNGTTILGTEGYLRTVADQNWQVAGIGDFDGDGKADILWRNSSSGENYVYLMNGTAIAGEGYLRTVADQAWQVAGVGDFNGDGRSDVLWRNSSSGENYLYPMNGLAILGTEGYLRTVADLNWNVAGVGDLDGDGKADVVWRNAATGENYFYPMNGTAILGTEGYLRTVADLNWKIVGTGDFDGDGKADIPWRNSSTGENYLYPMNGTTILGTEGYLRTVPDQDWQVKGTGDYDGNGKADILWRNSSSGENYLYFMNGTTISGEGYLRTVAQTEWFVAGGGHAPAVPQTIEAGEGPFPLPGDDPAVQVDGVGRNAGGDLVRDASAFANRFLWIPNDREGTVSKIDVTTGTELARYASVTRDPARVVNHVARSFPAWNADANGSTWADNRPQYTAVDYAGDAWAANVAHDLIGLQSTLTKIRGNSATCPDLNGNGVVDTSREVNGTPGIQLADPAEFLGEADECIAMTVVVGDVGTDLGGIRALAIDAGRDGAGSDAGNPWVGVSSEQAFYQLHGATGAILQKVATPGVRAFTAAIDSLGRLWARDHCCGTVNLGRIDTTQNPAPFTLITTVPAFTGLGRGNYGLAVDLANRVWVAGYPYGGAMRYDPATGIWNEATIPGYASTGQARSIAVDGLGSVWTSFHPNSADGLVARIDTSSATATGAWQLDDSGGGGAANIPVGVGVDYAGNIWTANQATSNVSRMHIDPVTGEPAPHPATGDFVDVFPVGANPYVHSDFTGMGYRRVTRPDGEYRVSISPCPGGQPAHWLAAEWSATTPAGTRVELWLRTSNDQATVAQAPLQGPWTASPADLQSLPGPVGDSAALQLTLRLVSENPGASPTVHSYQVSRTCPAP